MGHHQPEGDPADRVPVIQPYDLPALRRATELTLSLPRVGFYTTPAFLALWNTNDSNQHRVTANQTLLVAFGQAFTADNAATPFTTAGLDEDHAVTGGECIGCHLTLDPMRQFWGNQLDYNDRNDFPAGNRNNPGNPRPTGALVNEFAFGDVTATGTSMDDLGGFLTQVTDGARPAALRDLGRAAALLLRELGSRARRRIPSSGASSPRSATSTFNFAVLLKEFFSSPLVTGASATGSYPAGEVPISISRRDHLCASLSNRLGKPDLCAQATVLPTSTQTATARIASSVASDAFSRGAESPVTPADPTLFYRAATELLCENIAIQVVDATTGAVFSSTDVPGAISGMVRDGDGLPARQPAVRAGAADPDRPQHHGRDHGQQPKQPGARRPTLHLCPRVRVAAGARIGL